jgi:hypothetical protein
LSEVAGLRSIAVVLRGATVLLLLAASGLVACMAGRAADDRFSTVHVADVAALRAEGPDAVTLVDANGADFRTREGVIPGAVLLSSYGGYDVAAELPPRNDARLVFYCANEH